MRIYKVAIQNTVIQTNPSKPATDPANMAAQLQNLQQCQTSIKNLVEQLEQLKNGPDLKILADALGVADITAFLDPNAVSRMQVQIKANIDELNSAPQTGQV